MPKLLTGCSNISTLSVEYYDATLATCIILLFICLTTNKRSSLSLRNLNYNLQSFILQAPGVSALVVADEYLI